MIHVLAMLFCFGLFGISWAFLRLIARSICRDGMLKQLDNGKTFYSFQRKFCGIHPTENRAL
jgi:hypothetical protein